MSKKPKFKPEITRVKLDPEQAVLNCACYNLGLRASYLSSTATPSGFSAHCLNTRQIVWSVDNACSSGTCGGGQTAFSQGGSATSS
jgi:hypothetical protein